MKLNKITRSIKFIALLIVVMGVSLVFGTTNISKATGLRANNKSVCSKPSKGNFGCLSRVKTDEAGITPATSLSPVGYGPMQFHTAYDLPFASSNPATIAIVDAYDHPSIKADLDIYNQTFGLPFFPNCSNKIKTGCFSKVNQTGSTKYPKVDSGWSLEIALDVETAHQICPNCKLILVEANSNSYRDLMTAVDTARKLGAKVISNSYGSAEFARETLYDSYFNYPGTAFVFSSGDNGYGTSYPAASNRVIAAGGTSLYLTDSNKRQSEVVWSGSGSGCSLYESKPAFQTDQGCANRTIADISAAADPNTGAAVYSSVPFQAQKGWFQVGGTSLSAPLIAGMYALAGGPAALTSAVAALYNASPSTLYDVLSGSNGTCGTFSYLCTGIVGFDGPSGLGSPIGLGAF